MARPALISFVATTCLLASPALWAAEPTSAPATAASTPPPASEAAAPGASSDDSYLDADFPEAKSLSVEPPVAGNAPRPHTWNASPANDGSSYPSAYEASERPADTQPLAVERGPFIAAVGDIVLNDYYSLVGVGVTAGGYLAKRLRLAGYISAPFGFEAENDYGPYNVAVDEPKVMLGGTFGVALVRRRVFTLSVAADVSTTNSSDLGWNVGVALPLEWVTRSGFRIGVTPSLVQNIGSSEALRCNQDYDVVSCTDDSGPGAMGFHLQVGIGMTLK